MLSHVPWNLTRKLTPFRDADAIVLSLGKSGRTWLRVMLHHALALEYGIPFDPNRLDPGESGAPRIVFTHELATHLRDATLTNQLLGKAILPRRLTDRKRMVVLARDPRTSSRAISTRPNARTRPTAASRSSCTIRAGASRASSRS